VGKKKCKIRRKNMKCIKNCILKTGMLVIDKNMRQTDQSFRSQSAQSCFHFVVSIRAIQLSKKFSVRSYDMIYLLTATGLTPGGNSTVHIYTQTVHRTTKKQTIHRMTKKYIEQHKKTIHRTTQKIHRPTQNTVCGLVAFFMANIFCSFSYVIIC
jgi:hypothetical protein